MFLGEYRHQTDEKNRLRVPAKLKKALGKNYIITKGTNGCLFLFSAEGVKEQLVDKLNNVAMFDLKAQQPIRMLLSSAFEAEEDNQGRFLLEKALREFADIKKGVVFIGVGTRIEIWASEKWDKYLEADKDDFDKILGGLKEYGV